MHLHDQYTESDAIELGRKRPDIYYHPRFQTGLELYTLVTNTHDGYGPLRPSGKIQIAQNSYGKFFRLVASSRVSYTMACMAEIQFNNVRHDALTAIRIGHRSKISVGDCSMQFLADMLGFDEAAQAQQFCEACGMRVAEGTDGAPHLMLRTGPARLLDPNNSLKQPFSEKVVEHKRRGRTLPQVIHGLPFKETRATEAVANDAVGEGASVTGSAPQPTRETPGPALQAPPSTKSPLQARRPLTVPAKPLETTQTAEPTRAPVTITPPEKAGATPAVDLRAPKVPNPLESTTSTGAQTGQKTAAATTVKNPFDTPSPGASQAPVPNPFKAAAPLDGWAAFTAGSNRSRASSPLAAATSANADTGVLAKPPGLSPSLSALGKSSGGAASGAPAFGSPATAQSAFGAPSTSTLFRSKPLDSKSHGTQPSIFAPSSSTPFSGFAKPAHGPAPSTVTPSGSVTGSNDEPNKSSVPVAESTDPSLQSNLSSTPFPPRPAQATPQQTTTTTTTTSTTIASPEESLFIPDDRAERVKATVSSPTVHIDPSTTVSPRSAAALARFFPSQESPVSAEPSPLQKPPTTSVFTQASSRDGKPSESGAAAPGSTVLGSTTSASPALGSSTAPALSAASPQGPLLMAQPSLPKPASGSSLLPPPPSQQQAISGAAPTLFSGASKTQAAPAAASTLFGPAQTQATPGAASTLFGAARTQAAPAAASTLFSGAAQTQATTGAASTLFSGAAKTQAAPGAASTLLGAAQTQATPGAASTLFGAAQTQAAPGAASTLFSGAAKTQATPGPAALLPQPQTQAAPGAASPLGAAQTQATPGAASTLFGAAQTQATPGAASTPFGAAQTQAAPGAASSLFSSAPQTQAAPGAASIPFGAAQTQATAGAASTLFSGAAKTQSAPGPASLLAQQPSQRQAAPGAASTLFSDAAQAQAIPEGAPTLFSGAAPYQAPPSSLAPTPSTADIAAPDLPKKVTFAPAAQELPPTGEGSAMSSPTSTGGQETKRPEPSPEVPEQLSTSVVAAEGGLLDQLETQLLPDVVGSVRDEYEEQRARDFRRRKVTERYCRRWRRVAERRATIRHGLESRSRLRQFINESRERQKQEQQGKKRKSELTAKTIADDMVEGAKRKQRRVFEASLLSASQPELGRHKRSRTEFDADPARRAARASTSGAGSSGGQERRRSHRGPALLSGGSIVGATKSTSARAAVVKFGIHDTTKSDLWRLKAAGLELLPNGSVQPFGMPPSPRTGSKRSFDESNGQEGGSESGSDDSLRQPKSKPPPWILSTFASPRYSHVTEEEAAQPALVREHDQSKRAPKTNGTGAAGPASAAQDVIVLDDSSEGEGAGKPADARAQSPPRHEPEPARKRTKVTNAKDDDDDLFARVRRINEAMEECIAFYRSEIDKQKERWKQALLGRQSQGATASKSQAPTTSTGVTPTASKSVTSKRPSQTPNATPAKRESWSRNGIHNWLDGRSRSRSWYRS